MTTTNRGGNRQGQRRAKTNKKGRTQDDNGLPLAAAIGAAAAVGAGIFLWSRRNQISGQIADLANGSSGARESGNRASVGDAGSGRTQSEIAEEALTLKEIGAAS